MNDFLFLKSKKKQLEKVFFFFEITEGHDLGLYNTSTNETFTIIHLTFNSHKMQKIITGAAHKKAKPMEKVEKKSVVLPTVGSVNGDVANEEGYEEIEDEDDGYSSLVGFRRVC